MQVLVDALFEPFFLAPSGPGRARLFAIHHPPHGPLRGMVVHVHPFAEEMNKSRRMAARQSRALAAQGWAVLQFDLRGCGDSEGELGNCSWADWVDDVTAATAWLVQRYRGNELWLWGHRAGALLAVAATAPVRALGVDPNFMFWQPAASGRVLLQQFLRTRVASEMLAGQARGGVEALRKQLAAGQQVDVAGYMLARALCDGFDGATVAPPAGPAGRSLWFELRSQPGSDEALSPALASASQAWTAAGWDVASRCVQGPAFWQTTEIEDAPDLLAATLSALGAATPCTA